MRTDEHKPSAIVPADYDFVANGCIRFEGIGTCAIILQEREILRAHMARTGGCFAHVETTGNCMVCGSVNMMYDLIFYHAKSNSYISMGSDCAAKIFDGADFGHSRFRKKIHDVREAQAGKRKAEALLGDAGLSAAWALYVADMATLPNPLPYEERVIRDMVGKLVQYGNISEKATNYMRALVEKIPGRDQRNAERAEKWALEQLTAEACPKGRVKVEGTVIKTDTRETQFGIVEKMLVKSDKGFRVWSTIPAAMPTPERGARVAFTATLTPSTDDPQFGFAKRPTVAREAVTA
jgi:hypothetical protein